MGSSQRLAAVAAVSHARHYYNHTQPDVLQTETSSYNINIFFVSATLCGVLVAVCAACWRRSPSSDKPEDVVDCHGVYTVSGDSRLLQEQMEMPGPPPAYETVVEGVPNHKDCHTLQENIVRKPARLRDTSRRHVKPSHRPMGGINTRHEEVVTESCMRCQAGARCDSGLPSYEAAVQLRDTKL